MRELEQQISALIKSQFPGFYVEDQAKFVEFVRAYYEWMEQQDQTIGQIRRLSDIRDIDKTVDEFYTHFRKKYLENFPESSSLSTPFLVKNALDIYKAKGTEEGIKLLLQILYREASKVYLPGTDVLKPSNGEWVVPRYLELSSSPRTLGFINKEIVGELSGARAFAESLVTKRTNGKYIDVLYISNLKGRFLYGERITDATNLVNANAPVIIGSLTSIDIIDGGQDLEVGDILDVVADTGRLGKALVTGISNETGIVRFTLDDGGFGYSTSANVLVSQRVLNLYNITNANTSLTGPDPDLDFELLETVTQPLFTYEFDTSTNNAAFDDGAYLTVYYPNNSVKATARSLILLESNSTSGFVKSYPTLGTVVAGDTIYSAGNTASAVVIDVVDSTATGIVMGSRETTESEWTIGVYNTVNQFVNTAIAPITGSVSNTQGYIFSVGGGEGATFSVGVIAEEEDVIFNTDLLEANNIGLVPFMNIVINGTGSNSTGYGFPKKASANLTSIILDALTFDTRTVGVIDELSGINRGQDYTQDPIVLVKEEVVYDFDKRNYQLRVTTPVAGAFVNGEIIQQTFETPMTVLTLDNFSGNTILNLGEVISQSSTSAYGIVYRYSTGGGVPVSVTLTNVSGTFLAGPSYPVTSSTTAATADVTDVSPITTSTSARGQIYNLSNSTYFSVKRLSLANNFITGTNILGTTSGTVAQIIDIYTTVSSELEADARLISGLNAVVSANVQVANNVATELQVISSGFGYLRDESVTLTKPNFPYVITGKANTYYDGIGQGFFASSKGFLSDDKYIHDSDYYQEYSYEIQTKIPFAKYKDIMKKIMHVAGTKMFGKTLISSNTNVVLEAQPRETERFINLSYTNTYSYDNTSIMGVGSVVYQSNGSSNTFVGTVETPLTATITTWPISNSSWAQIGMDIVYPDVLFPEVVGTISGITDDPQADRRTFEVTNIKGNVFPDNTRMMYLDDTGSYREIWSIKTINKVGVSNTQGQHNISLPLRFGSKQANVQYVTIGFE